jgi:hypothetical protein
MRWLWWALALSVLAACGKDYDVGPFESYVETFQQQALASGHPVQINSLRMSFKEVSEEYQGYCTVSAVVNFNGAIQVKMVPTIYIDPAAWQTQNDWGHEAVIMHELGHCILGRGHDTRMQASGIPRSVMYPSRIDQTVYQDNRAYFFQELFNPPDPDN